MKRNKFTLLVLIIIAVSAIGTNLSVKAGELPHFYKEASVHDPSIIKDGEMYYVFGTHGGAAKSNNLMDWDYFVNNQIGSHTLLGNIKQNLKVPFEWAGNSNASDIGGMGIWAPDVYYNDNYLNSDGTKGAYLMYFSLSTGQDDGVNEHYRSLIGLASSQDIEGPYEYQDTVIYTGFKDDESLSSYHRTDFNKVFPGVKPRQEYFKGQGGYDFDRYPNAIDPTIVDSHDGKLYMVYGSWNAGVWILELDESTGLPIRGAYEYDSEITNIDPYFGKQISGGFWTSGEGPYVRYHEESGYYHLYVTYGGLVQNDTYNIRFFRSKSIDGPYEDINGKSAIFTSHRDNAKTGNRLLGSFEFLATQTIDANAKFYGYRVPGHNSVLYNEDGKDFLITHTRFQDKGEGHEVRVHELFFNDEGWPMVATQRYSDEDEIVQKGDVSGSYLIVRQGQDNSKLSKESVGISLEDDGSISGQLHGQWSFDEDILQLEIANKSYKGFMSKQTSSITGLKKDLHFTAIGDSGSVQGESILGIKISDLKSEDLLNLAFNDLELARTSGIIANLKLPSSTYGGTQVSWTSSNNKIINNKGIVKRTDNPEKLKLTATLKYGENIKTKTFDVDVTSKDGTQYKDNRVKFVIIGLSLAIVVGLGFILFFKIRNMYVQS